MIEETNTDLLQTALENAFDQSPYLAHFTEGYNYEVIAFSDVSIVDFSLSLAENAAQAKEVVKAADLKEAVQLISQNWENNPFDPVHILFDFYVDETAVQGLVEVALLRNMAAAAGVYEVKQTADNLLLYQRTLDLSLGSKLNAALPGRVMINAGPKPYVAVKIKQGLSSLDVLREALQAIEKSEEA